jgi:benzoate-CoA ligase
MLASPDLPRKDQVALRLCSSAGEALPADIGERWTTRFGCEIIDGIGSTEMLHVFLSNAPGDVRYGTTGKAVPGYEVQLRGEQGEVITGHNEIGDLYIKGPSAALMYWNNREKNARYLSRRMDQEWRQILARLGRLLHLCGSQRRHAQSEWHLCVAV